MMITHKLFQAAIVLILLAALAGGTPEAVKAKLPPSPSMATPNVSTTTGDEYWDHQFLLGVYDPSPGFFGDVYAIAVSGNNVYVGGDFTYAGNVAASNIAVWNSLTHTWSALGSGVDSRVQAITISGDYVYVGGYFNHAGGLSAHCIAVWNSLTESWSALGSGLENSGSSPKVAAIAVAGNGDVYAGGEFDMSGGHSALMNVARWSGGDWHPLGSGVANANPSVTSLAIIGSYVYVGGGFLSPAKHLALWDGLSWFSIGGGTDNTVLALATMGTSIIVGGEFTHVDTDNKVAGHIALWSGSTWNTLAGGLDDPDVTTILVTPSGVYAGGRFTYLADGTTAANRVAHWNGGNWEAVGAQGINIGGGVDNNVYALVYSSADNSLYLGGFMKEAGTFGANHIARWSFTDTEWYGLGNSVNGYVNAITLSGNYVYVGGRFTSAGGLPASRIARWNKVTGTWSTLEGGMSGCSGLLCRPNVNAIAVNGTKVYVAGNFNYAGGIPAKNIAVWDNATDSWSALGGGLHGCSGTYCGSYVKTLLIEGERVYAGGNFLTADSSTTVNHIAYYSGTSWYPLGSGTDNIVRALTTYSTGILVGGDFLSPGNYLATYSGGIWAPIVGINAPVYVLHRYGSTWLIGGTFTNAGNSGASWIVKWNGYGGWEPLGANVDGAVYALDVWVNSVYVGGSFHTAGLGGANHIAIWSGSQWSSLGNGTNDDVYAVAQDSKTVYVGGIFTNAGGKPSSYFGRWTKRDIFLPIIFR